MKVYIQILENESESENYRHTSLISKIGNSGLVDSCPSLSPDRSNYFSILGHSVSIAVMTRGCFVTKMYL